MANALTALRLLLVAPFAFFMARGDSCFAGFALIVWVVAVATDLLDGRIARRTATVSVASGTFDHTTDFLFVTSGITAAAWRGAIPWVLPALITAAFTQYAIDSYWIHSKAGLRGNKLGRYNGMLYFVPPCVEALVRLGADFLRSLLTVFVWLLVLSTIASMVQRFLSSRTLSENLASRAPQK
jgi:CDP-diacylglycerol--glycerol-3-phosphate 3-phosphatidyltransferase